DRRPRRRLCRRGDSAAPAGGREAASRASRDAGRPRGLRGRAVLPRASGRSGGRRGLAGLHVTQPPSEETQGPQPKGGSGGRTRTQRSEEAWMTHDTVAILFDIDGTLITTGGAGAVAWRMAFEDLYD